MAFSIETRVPFLTLDLLEFSLSIPEQYKISQQGETKVILREALRSIVPNEILNRKDKIGFEADQNLFFKFNKNLFQNDIMKWARADTNIIESYFKSNLNITDDRYIGIDQHWRFLNYAYWYSEFENELIAKG